MMFNEIKSGEIPCLSFLKGTNYAMYIGPELSPKQLEQLRSKDIPIPVIYLPEILEQLSESVVKYNFPGVNLPEGLSAESIYAQIRAEFGGRVTLESRLIVKYDGDVLVIYDAKDCFSLVISYLINKCAPPMPRKYSAGIWGGIRKKDIYDDLYEEIVKECRNDLDFEDEDVEDNICVKEDYYLDPNQINEESFDEEMANAMNEAQGMIQNLLMRGCPPELILSWLNQSVKLSRLRITKQFKIFLVDYDNVEIRMGPLPKTIFLFYLRHPEGVMIPYLQNYKDELREIYGRVCNNDDPQKMEESINRLINPFDNSICEKCAAIKRSFVLKISDTVAINYYVHGPQGEKKRISLDRSLVEWECEW